METYSLQDIEVKIKSTEEKYQKQVRKGANRSLLLFLKEQIEYLKNIREELVSQSAGEKVTRLSA